MENFKNTEKTVAFFNIKTDGTAQIRSPKDYIATMIELGGARYAFRDIKPGPDSGSTLNISMEEFYATAVDADYLIYNGTIADPIDSLEDLYALSDLFKDFKAVKEGNVWCSGNNMYQATDIVGDFILDINNMVTDGDESKMTFITKVQ
jgi:iron complex transport system substrate-binding protein